MEYVVRCKLLGWYKGICDIVFFLYFVCLINLDREVRVVGYCVVII